MPAWVWVALGGAVGSVARYGFSNLIHSLFSSLFPFGTLGVNLLGCFLMGFISAAIAAFQLPPELRALLLIGFLGGFTTFSAFGMETYLLMKQQAWGMAGLYVALSSILGVTLCFMGFKLGSGLLRLF